MVLFGFFSLVMVLVYWINRAVILFDRLIASGQSAGTFLELTALTLPNVIRLVLPFSAYAAVIFTANRLSSESELVVVQATGYSPWRLARPVLVFGGIVALLLAVLVHVLVPAATRELSDRQAQIAQNVTARLLTEGEFIHPVAGLTFYVREITPDGELRDIFLSDSRAAGARTNYSSRTALLIPGERGPKLVMLDGMAQTLDTRDQRLAVTTFSDFSYDIGALMPADFTGSLGIDGLPTPVLLNPPDTLLKELRRPRHRLIEAAHERIAQSTMVVATSVLGFACLLLGGFSRFGLWRQILFAVVAFLALKSIENALIDVALRQEGAWPAVYGATLVAAALTALVLWAAGRPDLFRAPLSRLRREAAP